MNKQVVLIVDVVGVVVDVVDLIIVWQFFLKKICRLKLLNTLLKLAYRPCPHINNFSIWDIVIWRSLF